MILYESTLEKFYTALLERKIVGFLAEEYQAQYGRKIGSSIRAGWKFSFEALREIIEEADLDFDCGVRIDYVISSTTFDRLYVLLAAKEAEESITVIEMIPYEEVELTNEKDIVVFMDDEKELKSSHPSYNAVAYARHLAWKKTAPGMQGIRFHSCVYMLGCTGRQCEILNRPEYDELTNEAPVFSLDDTGVFAKYLHNTVVGTDGKSVLACLHDRDVVSKEGLAAYAKIVEDSPFSLNEEQRYLEKVAFQNVAEGKFINICVEGRPGTGKTFLALSMIHSLSKAGKQGVFLSAGKALTGYVKSSCEKNQEKVECFTHREFFETEKVKADYIIVDEAQEMSVSLFSKIEEYKLPIVWLYDPFQRLGHGLLNSPVFQIGDLVANSGSPAAFYKLGVNERYQGKEGALSWLYHNLQMGENGNYGEYDTGSFELEYLDSIDDVRKYMQEKNSQNSICRLLVNINSDTQYRGDSYWLSDSESLQMYSKEKHGGQFIWSNQDGDPMVALSVRNMQGLELDYACVIIGSELSIDERTGLLTTSGHKDADRLMFLKQIYYVLSTRGRHGVAFYCCDKAMGEYLGQRVGYARRRFRWISEYMAELAGANEKEILEQREQPATEAAKHGEDSLRSLYKQMESMITTKKTEIRQQFPNLDEKAVKLISDWFADALLLVQNQLFSEKRIVDEISAQISRQLGEHAWNNLMDKSRKFLVSSEITFRDLKNYNQLFDFSGVCMLASKAVECEMVKRYFTDYIEYLKEKYGAQYLTKLPDKCKYPDGVLKGESEVTLGDLHFIVGLRANGSVAKQTYYDEFCEYAEKKIFKPGKNVAVLLKNHLNIIAKIRKEYRNNPVHKGATDVIEAKECIDYIVEIARKLGVMLDDYRK